MKISSKVQNSLNDHKVMVTTGGNRKELMLPSKKTGYGSDINGGELLFLSLATCFCNDLYREAAKRNIKVNRVVVEVNGDFGGDGDPADNITYSAKIEAEADEIEIKELIEHTDKVAKIHNTLRKSTLVRLMNDNL